MSDERSNYRSYLLRLWRSESEGRPVWRDSLESAQTGERLSLDLAGLLSFLAEHFGPFRLDDGDRSCEPQSVAPEKRGGLQ